MKIDVSKEDLVRALGAVSGVVERRQTLPILGYVLIESIENRVRIRATDLELSAVTEVDAQIVEEGASTIPARKLADFCRSLPDGSVVKITSGVDKSVVSSGRARFTLAALPPEEFPELSVDASLRSLSLPRASFRALLDKTAFAMAHQDVRYYLNGVLLEFAPSLVTSVATDGHRLARFLIDASNVPVSDGVEQVIVPSKSVSEMRRLLTDGGEAVELQWGERTFVLRCGETVISTRLVEGKYPDYRRVIPLGLDREAVLDREELRLALHRTSILSTDKLKGVRVTFDSGTVRLQSQNAEHEHADDEVACDYDGEAITVGFNIAYLLDVLQAASTSKVSVHLHDADSSSVWRGVECDNETFVVMPMRL